MREIKMREMEQFFEVLKDFFDELENCLDPALASDELREHIYMLRDLAFHFDPMLGEKLSQLAITANGWGNLTHECFLENMKKISIIKSKKEKVMKNESSKLEKLY